MALVVGVLVELLLVSLVLEKNLKARKIDLKEQNQELVLKALALSLKEYMIQQNQH